MAASGSTLMPMGLAESESNHSPPHKASAATVGMPAVSVAYTIRAGSRSTCVPNRRPEADWANTTTNAVSKIRNVFSGFIVTIG